MLGNRLIQGIVLLLKNLSRMLRGMSEGSIRRLRSDVQPSELLSIFVLRANEIVKKTNTIHHSRLMPKRKGRKKEERLETSVCRSQTLSQPELWSICSAHFDVYAPKPAIGRGVGLASAVFDVGLGFDADGKPYPEHANIIGWYDSLDKPDEELKNF